MCFKVCHQFKPAVVNIRVAKLPSLHTNLFFWRLEAASPIEAVSRICQKIQAWVKKERNDMQKSLHFFYLHSKLFMQNLCQFNKNSTVGLSPMLWIGSCQYQLHQLYRKKQGKWFIRGDPEYKNTASFFDKLLINNNFCVFSWQSHLRQTTMESGKHKITYQNTNLAEYESLIKSLITASELRLVCKQNSKAKPGKNHTNTLGDCLNHDPTWTHTAKPVGFSNTLGSIYLGLSINHVSYNLTFSLRA